MTKSTSRVDPPFPHATFPSAFINNIGFLANKVGERINLSIEKVTSAHGLNVRQYGLLLLLQAEGPQAQVSLSERVGLDRTSVMRNVDSLETRGFVRRDPYPNDRRKHSVALTSAGSELLSKTWADVQQAERDVTRSLAPPEQETLILLLKRLLESG